MASLIMFGAFIILVTTNTISGACTEQVFNVGVTNQRLVFKFVWSNGENRIVNCLHGTKKIGECDFFGTCPLDSLNTGAYTMSSNADLTEVYVSIVKFNSATAGNYSCSKNTGTTADVICVKDACESKYAVLGAQNTMMSFNFTWTSSSKSITCVKNETVIGECHGNLVVTCGLASITSNNVYRIASNTDLTSVSLTILYLNESTAGNYSCSKRDNADVQTVCMEINQDFQNRPSSGLTTGQISGLVVGVFYAGLLAGMLTFFVLYRRFHNGRNDCFGCLRPKYGRFHDNTGPQCTESRGGSLEQSV